MTACDFSSIRCFSGGEKRFESKGHLGNEREVHVLARDGRPCGDEAGMASHELHEADATGHAPRLGVRAIEHAHSLLNGAEKPECAGDEAYVIIDGLRHADDGRACGRDGGLPGKGRSRRAACHRRRL